MKRKLAEGGMAELFLCASRGPEGFEKEVVIKRIKAFLSNDQTFIDMFMAEARLASRLNHVNVVQIFDFDKHEDAWFIAMEYIYGASLWELRRRCRELGAPLPTTLVAEIGAQTARGLHYAHTLTDKGKPLALVHRDVTPHNVLLSFDGAVKLTDFGIAKAGTSFTAPGMLKGKFAYMAPEQARGERVDARTDVFALGITLWEMLTGGRLFEGDSDLAVLRAVQESQIPPPERLNENVPADLSEIILKALARPVEERYQTAQEFERALATFVLKNAASTEDTNVGLYLRQMFRDELEEAARAMSSDQVPIEGTDGSGSQPTPSADAYAIGNTLQFNRHGDATEQTATPQPAVVPEGSEKPKTALMPGVRASRPLPPLMDADDGSSQRTDQMAELSNKQKTEQMRGIKPSRKKLSPVEALPPPPPAPVVPISATMPGIARPEPMLAVKPKRSLLPWIVAACLAVGLIGGLGLAVSRSWSVEPPVEVPVELTPPPPSRPSPVIEAPVVRAPEPEPAPAVAVAAAPVEAARAPEPVEAAPVTAEKPKGVLVIDALPFGTLVLNGKRIDIEGTRRFPLPPGNYTFQLEHPKLTQKFTVPIVSGQTARPIRFRPLEPKP